MAHNGRGPSHLETFDYKPELGKRDGQAMPESMTKGQQLAQLQGQPLKCFGPQTKFKKFGQSGTEICELFPEIGSVVDDICFIRSMTTDAINHDPAHMFMNTGSQIAGRPTMGAWVLYGLGSESVDLPGFVVLTSLGKGGQNQPIAARQWSSGFLPSRYQGVHLRGKGEPSDVLGQSAWSWSPSTKVAGGYHQRPERPAAANDRGSRDRDAHCSV